MGTSFYKTMRTLAKPVIFFTRRYKIHDGRNVPENGRVIICSNHISGYDPLIIGIGSIRPIRFMAKKELFKNKFLVWFFDNLGCIAVDRQGNDIKAMKEFMRGLKNEEAMGIFIEGTRSKTGEFLEPKEGPAMFALQCHSPVLPVCCTKSEGLEVVRFGKLIRYEELGFDDENKSKKEKLEYATNYIFDRIKELRKVDFS